MKNDYLFGISLIKVLEKNMLTYNDFVNLAKKKSYNEAVQSLIKRGYLKANATPEDCILQKKANLRKKLEEAGIAIPPVFYLENDFFNIEAAAKAIYSGTEREIPLKIPSSENSRNLLKKRSRDKYARILKNALHLLESGERCEEYIKDKLLETGLEISENDYFRNWFRLTHRLKTRDAENENIKMEYLKNHKHDISGIAPVFGYYYGSLIEIRNVRTVLSGKRAGATEKEITERLCNTYV